MWRQIILLGKGGRGGRRSQCYNSSHIFISHRLPLSIFTPLIANNLPDFCHSLSLSPYAHTHTHAHYFPPIASIFILFDLWYLGALFTLVIMISTMPVRDESLLHRPSGIERTRQIQGIGPGGIRIQPIALDEWQAGREEFD